MMQNIFSNEIIEHGGRVFDMPSTERSTEQVLKVIADENLLDCYIAQRKSPTYAIKNKLCPGCEASVMA